MARSSQYRLGMLGSISLLATGCIVPDAPEYGVPIVSDVVVDQNSIFPDPRSLILVDNTDGNFLDFTFVTHSEDAGQHIVTAFYIDYKHDGSEYIDHHNLPPLTFDVARKINWHFQFHSAKFPETPGCHVLTATVLHESGWDESSGQIGTPPDLAAVSWLVDFNDPPPGTVPLASCPDLSTISPVTGQE